MEEEVLVASKSEICVFSPNSLKEAINLHQKKKGSFIAGGTLMQLNWEGGTYYPANLINLETLSELRGIELIEFDDKSIIVLGSMTKLSECISDPKVFKYIPLLRETCRNIAAPAVRNRATIGGNIASGIGDSIPALLILDSFITIQAGDSLQTISLVDWLTSLPKYKQFLIQSINIPVQEKTNYYFYKKVGRRETFTPALVAVSGYCKWGDGSRLKEIKLAVGGGSHQPVRLKGIERVLENQNINKEMIFEIYPLILNEIRSYSDTFVTESYRKRVAANILIAELSMALKVREAGGI